MKQKNQLLRNVTGSPEDPVVSDPAYQQDLRSFSALLREALFFPRVAWHSIRLMRLDAL